jgi:hypothetical protein
MAEKMSCPPAVGLTSTKSSTFELLSGATRRNPLKYSFITEVISIGAG